MRDRKRNPLTAQLARQVSCSLALLGLQVVVRFAVDEYDMLQAGAGLLELPTLALAVACSAGSWEPRLLAAGW
jgi:hypothetical protein